MVGSIVWLAISNLFFPWFPEVWKDLNGDVSMFVGQTVNYTNILIGTGPALLVAVYIVLELLIKKENLELG